MANKDEIKKAILDTTDNPIVGAIVENVDALVEAIYLLDNPVSAKEVRVVTPDETR
jgi:hypothetical protein